MNFNDFYEQIVLDHATYRRNHRELDSYIHKVHYKNPTCGGVMTLYAIINGDKVIDLRAALA